MVVIKTAHYAHNEPIEMVIPCTIRLLEQIANRYRNGFDCPLFKNSNNPWLMQWFSNWCQLGLLVRLWVACNSSMDG
ncbi:hypothetical protein CEXT_700501 [Caerostris extrusa]|uniref:Uncharacterized protein n=1 Tax=Caerostris extrusa TaxID=172846 RepID=A0AAV4S0N3_CAEEX|nr:hypothetical protein CEXT_700501 [Caerostris extrusa]